MNEKKYCPPLSLTTQWEFWAWIYNMKRNDSARFKKKKQYD